MSTTDFSYQIQDKDEIQVYPVSSLEKIATSISVQQQAVAVARFVLDIHLGKLAASLRMLGFDTLYRNDYTDEELAKISSREERILLTRDRGLLMRSIVTYAYYVRATNPTQQLEEVLQRFNLFKVVAPFQRCIRCNGLLKPVSKESVIEQIPPKVRQIVDEFHRCLDCGKIYWKGSHIEQMEKFIERVIDSPK